MLHVDYLLYDYDARHYIRQLVQAFRFSEQRNYGRTLDLIDSVSYNQCESKRFLIETLEEQGIFEQDLKVGILGSWYGTLLIPALVSHWRVRHINAWDLDTYAIQIAKHLFYAHKDKVNMRCQDVWTTKPKGIEDCNLVINTSCEHMPPMHAWEYYQSGTTYVFQNNNLFGHTDHINCVKSIDEFESQMHPMLEIEYAAEKEIEFPDQNSKDPKRFTIIGKML